MQHRGSTAQEWSAAERAATALGWFSIGLGAAELFAPRAVARLAGIHKPGRVEAAVRALGARELATGAAIIANPRQATWLWSRVAGDGMDLWMMRRARQLRGADDSRFFAAAAAVAAVTAADIMVAQRLTSLERQEPRRPTRLLVARAVTVNRPADEVYRFWRDFSNLPRIMRGIDSIEITSPRQSHWRMRVPGGAIVEWDAEIVEEREPELISWRAEGATVSHAGSVRFTRAPGARGTEIVARFEYTPRGGVIGSSVAWLFDGLFEDQVQEDLRRCKQFLETGEIPLSDGPGLLRPAQPPADPADIRSHAGVH
jgi:uncharacterized membrane protein